MGQADSAVIALGVIALLVGGVIVVGYMDAQERAEQASQERFGGFESLGILLEWMSSAFQLLILNIFVTGIALIAAGVGLRRVKQLQETVTQSPDGGVNQPKETTSGSPDDDIEGTG